MESPITVVAPIRHGMAEYDPSIVSLVSALTENALSALREAGARLTVLYADEMAEDHAGWAEDYDGLLLLGGGDIDPALYGEPRDDPSVWGVNPGVDRFELALARNALAGGAPVFGICRGFQVLNVARGGTLHQALPDGPVTHRSLPPGPPMCDHPVRLDPASNLSRVLSCTRAVVRTGHHQGVRAVGQGLTPVAWADDNLVEALEDPATGSFGVQWHPEDPAADGAPLHALARHFVERCRARLGRQTA